MIVIPIQDQDDHQQDALVIVLFKDNLERMKAADPVEVQVTKTGKHLVNPIVQVCYEEDEAAFMKLVNTGDVRKILTHLQRGFQYRPEKGDHDDNYNPLGRQQ